MSREYITDSDGNEVKNSDGERLFYSDSDGDSDPEHSQTVYREHDSIFGGSSEVDSKYDPSTGHFKE